MGKKAGSDDNKIHATHLVLSCIDHRCTNDLVQVIPDIIKEDHANERYDHIALPGASLGVMQPIFPAWAEAFWQQLALALVLHPEIATVVVVDHMDCGAYKRLLPVRSEAREMERHREVTAAFAAEVAKRHPELKVRRFLLEPEDADKHHWRAHDLDDKREKALAAVCLHHP